MSKLERDIDEFTQLNGVKVYRNLHFAAEAMHLDPDKSKVITWQHNNVLMSANENFVKFSMENLRANSAVQIADSPQKPSNPFPR